MDRFGNFHSSDGSGGASSSAVMSPPPSKKKARVPLRKRAQSLVVRMIPRPSNSSSSTSSTHSSGGADQTDRHGMFHSAGSAASSTPSKMKSPSAHAKWMQSRIDSEKLDQEGLALLAEMDFSKVGEHFSKCLDDSGKPIKQGTVHSVAIRTMRAQEPRWGGGTSSSATSSTDCKYKHPRLFVFSEFILVTQQVRPSGKGRFEVLVPPTVIRSIVVMPVSSSSRAPERKFEVLFGDFELLFKCNTPEEAESWVTAIEGAFEWQQQAIWWTMEAPSKRPAEMRVSKTVFPRTKVAEDDEDDTALMDDDTVNSWNQFILDSETDSRTPSMPATPSMDSPGRFVLPPEGHEYDPSAEKQQRHLQQKSLSSLATSGDLLCVSDTRSDIISFGTEELMGRSDSEDDDNDKEHNTNNSTSNRRDRSGSCNHSGESLSSARRTITGSASEATLTSTSSTNNVTPSATSISATEGPDTETSSGRNPSAPSALIVPPEKVLSPFSSTSSSAVSSPKRAFSPELTVTSLVTLQSLSSPSLSASVLGHRHSPSSPASAPNPTSSITLADPSSHSLLSTPISSLVRSTDDICSSFDSIDSAVVLSPCEDPTQTTSTIAKSATIAATAAAVASAAVPRNTSLLSCERSPASTSDPTLSSTSSPVSPGRHSPASASPSPLSPTRQRALPSLSSSPSVTTSAKLSSSPSLSSSASSSHPRPPQVVAAAEFSPPSTTAITSRSTSTLLVSSQQPSPKDPRLLVPRTSRMRSISNPVHPIATLIPSPHPTRRIGIPSDAPPPTDTTVDILAPLRRAPHSRPVSPGIAQQTRPISYGGTPQAHSVTSYRRLSTGLRDGQDAPVVSPIVAGLLARPAKLSSKEGEKSERPVEDSERFPDRQADSKAGTADEGEGTTTMYVSEKGQDVLIVQKHPSAKTVKVMAGTREKLIEMTASEETMEDDFVETMLLTYPTFISGPMFMDMLVGRFGIVPKRVTDTEDAAYYRAWKRPIQRKVIRIISRWIIDYWSDFAHSELLSSRLANFVNELRESGYIIAYELFKSRIEHSKNLFRRQQLGASTLGAPDMVVTMSGTVSMVSQRDPKTIAEALTEYNWHYFSQVSPREFLAKIWSNAFPTDAEEASSADGSHIAGAKNKSSSSSAAANTAAAADARGVHKLEAFMQRFDGESSWVAREVCMQQGDRDRADMIVRFLSIAKHLIALNNFYSSFAVVVGLKMTPVRRMSAWSFVPEKWMRAKAKLESLMSPVGNMRAYRKAMESRSNEACVPFLPLYLKQLRFIQDGNQSKIDSHMLNFDKLRMINNTVRVLMRCQRQAYKLRRRQDLYVYLKQCELTAVCDMDALQEIADRNTNSTDVTKSAVVVTRL